MFLIIYFYISLFRLPPGPAAAVIFSSSIKMDNDNNRSWEFLRVKVNNPALQSYIAKYGTAFDTETTFHTDAPSFLAADKTWECLVCCDFNVDGRRRYDNKIALSASYRSIGASTRLPCMPTDALRKRPKILTTKRRSSMPPT